MTTHTAPASLPVSQRASAPIRILYAEDDRCIREMVALLLTQDGHAVVVAENGRKALDLASASVFDIVITDQNMPEMDGLTLIRELRNLSYGGKILVFAADLPSWVDHHFEALRVDAVLRKPDGFGALFAQLKLS